MAYHVITARLNGSADDSPVLNGALFLSKAARGHICALFCRPDPRVVAAAIYDGVFANYYDDLVASMEWEWTALANKALSKYETWREKNHVRSAQGPNGGKGSSAEWRDVKGSEVETICRQGAVSDILVAAMPAKRIQDPFDAGLEAALLDSGRPLLLLPSGKSPELKNGNVVIAWNGSAEAARAVTAAMPLLRDAEQVSIFTAEEGRVEPGMAEELATYLRWHGVDANVLEHGKNNGVPVEDALQTAAQKAGASLLVMGAYTHNRWRELIFGGVTRHMFSQARMPVLMAH